MGDGGGEATVSATDASRRSLLLGASAVGVLASAALGGRAEAADRLRGFDPASLAAVGLLAASEHGVVGDGETDDTAALLAALEAASDAGLTCVVAGRIRLEGNPTFHGSVDLLGTGDAVLECNQTNNPGLTIAPSGTSLGLAAAAGAGATTIMVSGASWSTDEHVGAWIDVLDPATNPATGTSTRHTRRVVASSATTLTLEHGQGRALPSGCEVTVYRPLDQVRIRDLRIEGVGTPESDSTGANLRIAFARRVVVERVLSREAGNYAMGRGNGFTIEHCDSLRMADCVSLRSGNFGCFVYDCDDVRIDRMTVTHWGGQFGVQLKDCRNGVISTSSAIGDGAVGDHGFDLKCSGLNPARDLSLVDCHVERARRSGVEFASLTNEGGRYSAEDFAAVDCRVHDVHSGSGFTTTGDAGADPVGYVWRGCVAEGCSAHGYHRPVRGHLVADCQARRNGFEGLNVTSEDVRVTGGVFQDNVQSYSSGVTRSSEILLSSRRAILSDLDVVRTSAGRSRRAVREGSGADANLVENCRIVDTAEAITQDYLLQGTTPSRSIARGSTVVDLGKDAATCFKRDLAALTVATAAELASRTSVVNRRGKVAGMCVFDLGSNRPVWAVGAAEDSGWVDANGSVVHTPT